MQYGFGVAIAGKTTLINYLHSHLPIAAPEKAILRPIYVSENQRPAKVKITFETFWNISNVVFLRYLVRITACGTFFRIVGNAYFDKWKIAHDFRMTKIYWRTWTRRLSIRVNFFAFPASERAIWYRFMYLKISVSQRAKLHLRRFKTSQM